MLPWTPWGWGLIYPKVERAPAPAPLQCLLLPMVLGIPQMWAPWPGFVPFFTWPLCIPSSDSMVLNLYVAAIGERIISDGLWN